MIGTIVGALVLRNISDLLVFMKVSSYWSSLVQGVILILAVAVSAYGTMLKKRGVRQHDGEKIYEKKIFPIIMTFVIALLLLLFISILRAGYANVNNLRVLSITASFLGMTAMGQMAAILTGGMDLSISVDVYHRGFYDRQSVTGR